MDWLLKKILSIIEYINGKLLKINGGINVEKIIVEFINT